MMRIRLTLMKNYNVKVNDDKEYSMHNSTNGASGS